MRNKEKKKNHARQEKLGCWFSEMRKACYWFAIIQEPWMSALRSVRVYWGTEKRDSANMTGMRPKNVFIHDNTTLHMAKIIEALLSKFGWYVFGHPPDSPDLALGDFFLFPKLKKTLRNQRFSTDKEVEMALEKFFQNCSEDFFASSLEQIALRYSKCLYLNYNYVEK